MHSKGKQKITEKSPNGLISVIFYIRTFDFR